MKLILLRIIAFLCSWTSGTRCMDQEKINTDLIHAARRGSIAMVQQLIAAKATVNYQHPDGQLFSPALITAARKGNRHIVELLIAARASINGEWQYAHTPLASAALGGQRLTIETLIDHGARIDPATLRNRAALTASLETVELKRALELVPKVTYQDLLINGAVVQRGIGQACVPRYQALRRSVLARYENQPIKILDIGAADGYFCLRAAQDNPQATCVMIEQLPHITEVCLLNTNINRQLIALNTGVSPQDLVHLCSAEYFDVIIANNILHHFKEKNHKKILTTLLAMGDHIVIETPPACGSDTPYSRLVELIERHGGTIIARTPRWLNAGTYANMYYIAGTGPRRPITPGITPEIYDLLQGSFPEPNEIIDTGSHWIRIHKSSTQPIDKSDAYRP